MTATQLEQQHDSKHESSSLDDRALVAQFLADRNGPDGEQAFSMLVQRYRKLVLGVCRRVLIDEHDAEDVFQATFLVFAQKARSIRDPRTLSVWLHRVAFRLALRVRRRRQHEPEYQPDCDSFSQATRHLQEAVTRDTCLAIDEELERLPWRQRTLVVLCALEGLSYQQVARKLGMTRNQVKWGLSKARTSLRLRLARRGLIYSVGMLGIAQTQAALAHASGTALVSKTTELAISFCTSSAATATAPPTFLAVEGLNAMLFAKIKYTLLVFAAAGTIGIGTIAVGNSAGSTNEGWFASTASQSASAAAAVQDDEEQEQENDRRARRRQRNTQEERDRRAQEVIAERMLQLQEQLQLMAEQRAVAEAQLADLRKVAEDQQMRAAIERQRAEEAMVQFESEHARAQAQQEELAVVADVLKSEVAQLQAELAKTVDENRMLQEVNSELRAQLEDMKVALEHRAMQQLEEAHQARDIAAQQEAMAKAQLEELMAVLHAQMAETEDIAAQRQQMMEAVVADLHAQMQHDMQSVAEEIDQVHEVEERLMREIERLHHELDRIRGEADSTNRENGSGSALDRSGRSAEQQFQSLEEQRQMQFLRQLEQQVDYHTNIMRELEATIIKLREQSDLGSGSLEQRRAEAEMASAMAQLDAMTAQREMILQQLEETRVRQQQQSIEGNDEQSRRDGARLQQYEQLLAEHQEIARQNERMAQRAADEARVMQQQAIERQRELERALAQANAELADAHTAEREIRNREQSQRAAAEQAMLEAERQRALAIQAQAELETEANDAQDRVQALEQQLENLRRLLEEQSRRAQDSDDGGRQ